MCLYGKVLLNWNNISHRICIQAAIWLVMINILQKEFGAISTFFLIK